jgi:DNA polymerase V
MNLIGVVDCNNFFVSCERLFRPDLQKKPVAVLSSNDGCIVARSQEVKNLGIPMGVPYFKVKDIIKDSDITLFSSHFTLYRDVSRRVFATLRDMVSEVEQYSVDEAFFVVPEGTDPKVLAKNIKDTVEKKIGIPVSVGIAASKTRAKYAVELAKKSTGVKILLQEEWSEMESKIQLTELWGVGRKSTENFRSAGYTTVADLLSADVSRIAKLFGVSGQRLMTELKGEKAYVVERGVSDQKSIMSTRSFKNEVFDLATLEDSIAYHARHIAADLRAQHKKATVVRITIRPSIYSDFLLQGCTLEAVLDKPSNDTFTLLNIAQRLLQEAYRFDVPYKKAGVVMSGLVSTDVEQQTLFTEANTDDSTKERLLDVIDLLNCKADRELITIGDRKHGDNWQAKKDRISPAYTTKWTDVALVKA